MKYLFFLCDEQFCWRKEIAKLRNKAKEGFISQENWIYFFFFFSFKPLDFGKIISFNLLPNPNPNPNSDITV